MKLPVLTFSIQLACYGWLSALMITASLPGNIYAQNALEGEGYVEFDRETEIRMARSAAPRSVSENASIWLLVDGKFERAIRGANDNHCLVMRSYPKSVEPLCYDAEASATILPIEIRRFELRNSGRTWDDIDQIIETEIDSGELSVPERPAMSYMLSSAQNLYAPDGRHVGNWKPHIMLYMPNMNNQQIGLSDGAPSFMQFADPGSPTAHLIVVVPEFVDP